MAYSSARGQTLFQRVARQRVVLLMLLPAFVLTFAFSYAPLAGWTMAFTDYRLGEGVFSGAFVGLKHFRRVFLFSTDFQYLLRNTLVMNLLSIFLVTTVSMFFSILLREVRWRFGARAVQTAAFFPYFISWLITYSMVWALMSVNSGAINQKLILSGVLKKGINLLGDARYSWGLIVGLNLWKSTGYNSIIFLAAISGIPQEQYESADLDGANRYHKIRYITLPYLLPTLSVLLIMNSGWVLNSGLDQYMVFQNGTNRETMEVLDMYIYRFGLKQLDYSYATAVGILKTVVSVLLLTLVNGASRRLGETSIF